MQSNKTTLYPERRKRRALRRAMCLAHPPRGLSPTQRLAFLAYIADINKCRLNPGRTGAAKERIFKRIRDDYTDLGAGIPDAA